MTLENKIDPIKFSCIDLMAMLAYPNERGENIEIILDELINHYKELKKLNKDYSSQELSEITYQDVMELFYDDARYRLVHN